MSDIKWIKLATDIFNNRKILQIEKLPDGDSIIVIWCKLLCLAGEINDMGFVYMTRELPYTEEMLANQFNRPLNTVKLALNVFCQYGMLEIIDDVFHISNWERYQNVDGMERVRDQTKKRVSRYRERKKIECNVTCNATVTDGNAVDKEEDKELEVERDKDKEKEEEKKRSLSFSKENDLSDSIRRVVDAWNLLSVYGIKQVSRLTAGSKRYDGISARLKQYSEKEVMEAIAKITNSDFLQGKNKTGWVVTFDWFVAPNNFCKVLDGNYDNRPPTKPTDRYSEVDSWV